MGEWEALNLARYSLALRYFILLRGKAVLYHHSELYTYTYGDVVCMETFISKNTECKESEKKAAMLDGRFSALVGATVASSSIAAARTYIHTRNTHQREFTYVTNLFSCYDSYRREYILTVRSLASPYHHPNGNITTVLYTTKLSLRNPYVH